MQQMNVEGSLSVHQCLRRLRMQRMNMVQSQVSHCGSLVNCHSYTMQYWILDVVLATSIFTS